MRWAWTRSLRPPAWRGRCACFTRSCGLGELVLVGREVACLQGRVGEREVPERLVEEGRHLLADRAGRRRRRLRRPPGPGLRSTRRARPTASMPTPTAVPLTTTTRFSSGTAWVWRLARTRAAPRGTSRSIGITSRSPNCTVDPPLIQQRPLRRELRVLVDPREDLRRPLDVAHPTGNVKATSLPVVLGVGVRGHPRDQVRPALRARTASTSWKRSVAVPRRLQQQVVGADPAVRRPPSPSAMPPARSSGPPGSARSPASDRRPAGR